MVEASETSCWQFQSRAVASGSALPAVPIQQALLPHLHGSALPAVPVHQTLLLHHQRGTSCGVPPPHIAVQSDLIGRAVHPSTLGPKITNKYVIINMQ